jgi:alginate O-acetyltransferase complex protein AlgI
VVFTSIDYALLLAAVFLAYWLLPARLGGAVLLVASVVFYAAWSVPYLGLLGACIAVGWACGLAIERGRSGPRGGTRLPVAVAAVVLLGVLAWFKYADFLLDVAGALGQRPYGRLKIVLPLAISFYVFQVLGYVIDVHRGAAPERSLARFALFVGFFPQLIAGPIARGHELLPQLRGRVPFDGDQVVSGLELLAWGVVKKVVLADNLAVLVDHVYGVPAAARGLDVVIATLAFGAQIYCDFSGYTDIARGSGRILGIELPINFRWPYLAASLTDFWHRWHITLSTWLRDYLYIPLGGNRARPMRVHANVLITMALGGLWHGASVTFLLWGVYHGLLLVAERVLGLAHGAHGILRRAAGVAGTFVAVQVGWAIFRAESWATLSTLAGRVVADPLGLAPTLETLAYLPLIAATYALHGVSAVVGAEPWARPVLLRAPVAAAALVGSIVLAVVFAGSSRTFIYFQF